MKDNERLAFYINAYNILVIKNVIDHFPIDSPMDVDGFFKKIEFNVGGKTMTLDELEYGRIVPLGGPYVHFGIVCAAKSCPILIRQPYTAGNVRALLKENADRFMRDGSKNYLDTRGKTLYLSQILSWFKEDFKAEFGSLKTFAMYHMSGSDSTFLAENHVKIEYLKYNWNLNGR